MIYTFVGVSAIAPALLLMWFFHRRDVFREPARDLWLTFGGGVLTVLPVLAVARPLEPLIGAIASPVLYGLVAGFLQAAIPEELCKLGILWLATRRAAFDEPMDGVVYGVAASLGFATLENIVYVAGGGLGVALTRALTAVPSHAFLGAIMGYFVGRAKFDGARSGVWWGLAATVPIALHGIYDWPLLAALRVGQLGGGPEPLVLGLLSLAPLVVVGEWICAVRLTRHLRTAQIGTLPSAERPFAPSPGERWSTVALVAVGGVVASLGGVVMLGGSLVVVVGSAGAPALGEALAVLILAGITPTAIGVALFLWGVRRLNDQRRVPLPAAVAPGSMGRP